MHVDLYGVIVKLVKNRLCRTDKIKTRCSVEIVFLKYRSCVSRFPIFFYLLVTPLKIWTVKFANVVKLKGLDTRILS